MIFNANATTVKHQFEVSLGVFDAFQSQFEYGIDKNNYHIDSKVNTQGALKMLYPFEAEYQSGGRIENEKLVPQVYKYKAKSRSNVRTKELVYSKTGVATYRISSKNGKENKVALKEEDKNQGTTDLQSVMAELVMQYNTLRFCDSRMEVFDGKRRFDVIFTDETKEDIKTPYHQGEAHKCAMYIDSLGSKGDDFLFKLTENKPVEFWLMQDEKSGAFFIAKILVSDTSLGDLTVLTNQIEVVN